MTADQKRIAVLSLALEFYGSEDNWKLVEGSDQTVPAAERDRGKIARDALTEDATKGVTG